MSTLGLFQSQMAVKNTFNFSFCLLAVILLSVIFSGEAMGQGNLLVTPRRLVFEGDKRIQEINLANTGKDTATYNISFKQIRMTENGEFVEISIPDSGQKFASDYLRFFPRRVCLAPNEAQLVKMQLCKINELESGEYRSHIYFRAIANNKLLGDKEKAKEASGLSVNLTPVFGITIPVIIRRGEPVVQVSFSDLTFERDKNSIPCMTMCLNRVGNCSVYGNIKVDYISPQGKEMQVAFVKGLAVYTPCATRIFRMKLATNLGIDYAKGKLRVVYNRQETDTGAVLCQAEHCLN